MAFALTKAKFYKLDSSSATQTLGHQCLEMTITRLAADVVLDISNPVGTFWTAAKADITFGPLATAALGVLAPLLAGPSFVNLSHAVLLGSAGLLSRVAGAPAGATEFQLNNAGTFPDFKPSIALFNNATPATITLLLVLVPANNVTPVEFI
jgi:hypothetical protein